MDEIESIAKALHGALTKYASLDPHSTARASVAQQIFGVPASKRLLPMLDELAHSMQRARKTKRLERDGAVQWTLRDH